MNLSVKTIWPFLVRWAPIIAIVISIVSLVSSWHTDNVVHEYMCIDEIKVYPANVSKLEREFIKHLLGFNSRRLSADNYNKLVNSKRAIINTLEEYEISLGKYDCDSSVYRRLNKIKKEVARAFEKTKERKIQVQPVINSLKEIGIIDFIAYCCE